MMSANEFSKLQQMGIPILFPIGSYITKKDDTPFGNIFQTVYKVTGYHRALYDEKLGLQSVYMSCRIVSNNACKSMNGLKVTLNLYYFRLCDYQQEQEKEETNDC